MDGGCRESGENDQEPRCYIIERKESMDLRKILAHPLIFDLFGKIIRVPEGTEHLNFVRDCVGNVSGLRILDLGCGTCKVLRRIHGEKLYVGIDISERYIEAAKKEFAARETASFYCMDLNAFAAQCETKFDLVVMSGVMHHITDAEVDAAMERIKMILSAGGRFVSQDGVYTDGMNPIARLLLNLDRGKYVRHEKDWVRLMKKHWDEVHYEIRTDTLRLPYSLIVFDNRCKDGEENEREG